MTVHLPPGIERIVNNAVRSGQYRSAEEVLTEAVTVWQERQTAAVEPSQDERQAAIERLKNFGKTHQLSLGGMTLKQLRDEARPGVGSSWMLLPPIRPGFLRCTLCGACHAVGESPGDAG